MSEEQKESQTPADETPQSEKDTGKPVNENAHDETAQRQDQGEEKDQNMEQQAEGDDTGAPEEANGEAEQETSAEQTDEKQEAQEAHNEEANPQEKESSSDEPPKEQQTSSSSSPTATSTKPTSSSSMTQGQREVIRKRIYNMFHKYIPSKLHKVDDAMIRYEGKHVGFIHALVEKFGPEPPLNAEEKQLDDDIKQARMKAAQRKTSSLHRSKSGNKSASSRIDQNETGEQRADRLREKYNYDNNDNNTSITSVESTTASKKHDIVTLTEDQLLAANLAYYQRTQIFDAERSERAKIADDDRRQRLKLQVQMSDNLRAVILEEADRKLRERTVQERAAVRDELQTLNERKRQQEVDKHYVQLLDGHVKKETDERMAIFKAEHSEREGLRQRMSASVSTLYKRAIRGKREDKRSNAVDREGRIQLALARGDIDEGETVKTQERPGHSNKKTKKTKSNQLQPLQQPKQSDQHQHCRTAEDEREAKIAEQKRKDEYLFALQVRQRHKIQGRMAERRHKKEAEIAARIAAEQRVQLFLVKFQSPQHQGNAADSAPSLQPLPAEQQQQEHVAVPLYLNKYPRKQFPIEAHRAKYNAPTLLPPILKSPAALVKQIRKVEEMEDEREKKKQEEERERLKKNKKAEEDDNEPRKDNEKEEEKEGSDHQQQEDEKQAEEAEEATSGEDSKKEAEEGQDREQQPAANNEKTDSTPQPDEAEGNEPQQDQQEQEGEKDAVENQQQEAAPAEQSDANDNNAEKPAATEEAKEVEEENTDPEKKEG